ncbi:MAG TPA: RodZ domain-containing protein [Telluria sp.]|jgi:cytoskeleton protein RodZ
MSSEWAEQAAPGAGNNAANHGLPGKTLAAQREAMGWTVEQVADQLKMAVRQVIALEAGDYANLPGPAVVRGFVRAYAKVVKLDAAPLVAMISLDTPELTEPGSRSVRRDKPATFSEVRFPTNGKRSSLPLGLIGAAVLLIAAAAGAWQFGLVPSGLLGGASQATPAAASGSQASVTVLPAPVVGDKPAANPAPLETTLVKPDERKPVIAAAPPLVSVLPPAGSATAPAATPVAGAAATPAAVTASAAVAGSNALVINVREDSWVEVRRARGAPLLSRLVKAGTVETLDITEPVTLVVGKPGGVSATLRGDAVALPDNGRTAKVKLK